MMAEEPFGYTRLLAERMPSMARYLHLEDADLAALMTRVHGRVTRSERALWEVWGRTKAA